MSELRSILSSMRPTSSTANDHISMKSILQVRRQVEPQLLNLTNQILTTSQYPKNLKITKIIPIPKPPKDVMRIEGWRPINIVPAISKIVEKVILKQMMKHLLDNNLIHPNHHGSVKNHSTQTLVLDLHDRLVEALETGEEVALLQLDQSKAYDLISHHILLEKLRILKFSEKTILTIQSYLHERRQYVQIENADSDVLLVGPKSVTQGSTLSCLFYLIFILDIPSICQEPDLPQSSANREKQPNIDTFVDDNFVRITKPVNDTLENEVKKTMSKIQDYMDANRLALNADKTKIMIVSKQAKTKREFEIEIGDKIIKHSKQMKVLGTVIAEDLNFNKHLTSEIIPNLKNRLRTLKMITKYMSPSFKKVYVNAIFRGKLLFALETWGGAKKPLINDDTETPG